MLVLAALAIVVVACATDSFPPDSAARSLSDLPGVFKVWDDGRLSDVSPTRGCRSPLVDPRNREQLVLVRSVGQRGDYRAPAGDYGLSPRELLRIDCSTGEPIGAVAR